MGESAIIVTQAIGSVHSSILELEVITVEFDFRQELIEEGESDEVAASNYAEELSQRFAESPEGASLASRGVVPGHYLGLFLDYALRYVGASPAELDMGDVRETLEVMAEKVMASPEDFDRAIPELEGFCDFIGPAFAFEKAAAWKRAIRDYAPEFRRTIRDPGRWGMAKAMMMEGLSRGYDPSAEEGLDRWLRTKQAEEIAEFEAKRGLAPEGTMSLLYRLRRVIGYVAAEGVQGAGQGTGSLEIGDLTGGEPDLLAPGFGAPSGHRNKNMKKQKSRRKQEKASRRRNRR